MAKRSVPNAILAVCLKYTQILSKNSISHSIETIVTNLKRHYLHLYISNERNQSGNSSLSSPIPGWNFILYGVFNNWKSPQFASFSSDDYDPKILTQAHFLVGLGTTVDPDLNLSEKALSRISEYY